MSNLLSVSLGEEILQLISGNFMDYVLAFVIVVLLVFMTTKYLKTSTMSSTEKMTNIAVFAALAFVFMFVGFPIIPVAPYLKVEFSVLVLLVLALRVDYKAAIVASLIVNFIDYLVKGSMVGWPLDQLANFTATLIFILPVLLLSPKKANGISIITGVVLVSAVMVILNYLVITPIYFGYVLPENFFWYCLSIYGPFNLIKWGLVGTAFYIVRKKMA